MGGGSSPAGMCSGPQTGSVRVESIEWERAIAMRFNLPRHLVCVPLLTIGWLCSAVAGAVGGAAQAGDEANQASSDRPPNVLLVYTDDHAQWAVGAYGNREVYTPNMDRLAADGMRFTQGFTKPVCSPSRAMLLTGQYSHRLGIPDYIPYGNPVHVDNGLPAGTPTIASLLHPAGYATGLVGKWHLGYGEKYYPSRFGFDFAELFLYAPPRKQYDNTGGVPHFLDGRAVPKIGKSADSEADLTTKLADRAIHFVRTNAERPFFLYLSFYRPHLQWLPVPDEDYARYKDRPLSVPDLPADSALSKEQLVEMRRQYYANITCADRNLGRVLGTLDDLDLADDTLVVFIGDNGYMVGQHGLFGKGNGWLPSINDEGRPTSALGRRPNMFDNSVLVPFVVRWPGVVRVGSTCDALVSTIDVLPTLAEVAGVETPERIDGRSLLPLLRGETDVTWRDAYSDTYDMIYNGNDGEKPFMRMIRTDDWKLVLVFDEAGKPLDGGSRHELFDLRSDPGELSNLYGEPRVRATRQQLETRLLAWMRETGVSD